MNAHDKNASPGMRFFQRSASLFRKAWTIVFVVLALSFLIGGWLSHDQTPRLASVVGRGTTFFALDMPPTADGTIERIRMWRTPEGVSASRGPQDPARAARTGERFFYIDLTESERIAILGLLSRWCDQSPTLPSPADDRPGYEIALVCANLGRGHVMRIAPEALPAAIKVIIDATFDPRRTSTH